MAEMTTVSVSKETNRRLKAMGLKSQDVAISKLLDHYERTTRDNANSGGRASA